MYYYEHENGTRSAKPDIVVETGGGPEVYFDSPFCMKWWHEPDRPTKNRRKRIEDTVTDLMTNFLYYDRKEDEDLPVGAIEDAIKAEEISVEEILAIMERNIRAEIG